MILDVEFVVAENSYRMIFIGMYYTLPHTGVKDCNRASLWIRQAFEVAKVVQGEDHEQTMMLSQFQSGIVDSDDK